MTRTLKRGEIRRTILTTWQLDELLIQIPNLVIPVKSETHKDTRGDTRWHCAFPLNNAQINIDISADLIEYLVSRKDIRRVSTRMGNPVKVEFYCHENTFLENDNRVNKGFPIGMKPSMLQIGAVVKLCWNDAPASVGIVTDVTQYAADYKNDRSFRFITADGILHYVTQTQIIKLIHHNVLSTLTQYETALHNIEALANKLCDSPVGDSILKELDGVL